MRGATEAALQHHQILRLPGKMNLMMNARHVWNVIYTMRGATECTLQHHQIITSPATKNDSPRFQRNFLKTAEMRDRSENDPSMIKPSVRNPPRKRGYFSRSPRTFSIEKYNISRSGYHSNISRSSYHPYQMLPLPQKVTVELFTKYCDCHEKWDLNFTK